jgi:N-ethylmaleimide reductase
MIKVENLLWHVGRMSHPDFHNGALPLSAAINPTIRHLLQKDLKVTVTPRK